MGLFRKPAASKKGLMLLAYGDSGVGKTTLALSAPKVAAIDSEKGMSWYEGREAGKNLVGVFNTQDFFKLEDAMNEVKEDHEGVESLVIDSETKFKENIEEVYIEIEKKRARKNHKDPDDANISIRSWGQIGQVSNHLQNKKLDLASAGINVISIAQQADIKDEKGKVLGHKPAMKKNADYDYDVVLYLFVKEAEGKTRHYAKVMKDRTETFAIGQIVENPTFDMWQKVTDAVKDSKVIEHSFADDNAAAKDQYEEQTEEQDIPVLERFTTFVENNPDKMDEIQKMISSVKLSKDGLANPTAADMKKLETILAQFKTTQETTVA